MENSFLMDFILHLTEKAFTNAEWYNTPKAIMFEWNEYEVNCMTTTTTTTTNATTMTPKTTK